MKNKRSRDIQRRAEDFRDPPPGMTPEALDLIGRQMPFRSYVSAVQSGDKRVELMRPRRWGDWLLLLVVLCWGFVMGFIAFAEGVDRGTTIGIESCRAGDTVLVDPAVQGID